MAAIELERLDGPPPGSFDCRRDEQNEYFHRHAWNDQQERVSTTYLLMVHGIAAAFLTICMDALPLSRRERGATIRYRWVSSLKLAQLGVDHRFQGSGVGRRAISTVIGLAQKVGELVGCRYVTLDAQPDLEAWYTRQGFVRNELHQQQRREDAISHQRDPDQVAVSMRYDLRRAP
jgi:GNAT superfamily N-acetyltransferase